MSDGLKRPDFIHGRGGAGQQARQKEILVWERWVWFSLAPGSAW